MHQRRLGTITKHRRYILLIITLLGHLAQPGYTEKCFQPCKPRSSLTGDIPQFCDTVEGRCSLCTTGVCKTSVNIPTECTCFCVLQYASRKYERDIKLCGHTAEDGRHTSQGDTQYEKPKEDINSWCLAFVIVVPLLLAIIVGLIIRRNRQCTKICRWPQKQPNDDEDRQEIQLDEVYLNSIKVTAPAGPEQPTGDQLQRRPNDTRGAYACLPVQEERNRDYKEGARTKTTQKEKREDETDPGGLRHEHATEMGPEYPSEGVPVDYNPCL